VDQEGTKSGFDVPLIQAVNSAVSIPVIVSGGYGQPKHIAGLLDVTKPSGLCFASVLHYKTATVDELRENIELAQASRIK
jgi:cyclase